MAKRNSVSANSKKLDPPEAMWLRGYFVALASVNRLFDKPTYIRNVMEADGLTLEDAKRAAVDPYDMRELRKGWT